jgi:hypothetical protein
MELFAINTYNNMVRESRRLEMERVCAILRGKIGVSKSKVDFSQFFSFDTLFSEFGKKYKEFS